MQENQPFQQSPPFLLEGLENSEFFSEFFSELFSLNFIQRKNSEKKLKTRVATNFVASSHIFCGYFYSSTYE
jgi:hypothetical protein